MSWINSNEIELLKDFCEDEGELQYLCKEFNCDEYENIYTKEQAEYLSDEYEEFRKYKDEMNKEEGEN